MNYIEGKKDVLGGASGHALVVGLIGLPINHWATQFCGIDKQVIQFGLVP